MNARYPDDKTNHIDPRRPPRSYTSINVENARKNAFSYAVGTRMVDDNGVTHEIGVLDGNHIWVPVASYRPESVLAQTGITGQEAARAAADSIQQMNSADESFWVNIGIPAHDLPQHTQDLLREVVAPAMHRFAVKNVEYGETANHLGSKGQFADINRKFGKLKRLMWDQNVPEWAISEGVEEVLQDLIGHCILSIYYIRQETSDEA